MNSSPGHAGEGFGNGFRWRSHEISRIEGLSDAVFAFAVTLLIISLEVPRTFAELWEAMHGFFAFGISFAVLFQVWYSQYIFFRRYALQDPVTIALNAFLLFLVLFFTYPLKFVFSFVVNLMSGGQGMVKMPNGRFEPMLTGNDPRVMMICYGLGFAAIYGLFSLLYAHALRRRRSLGLNEIEVFDTRSSIVGNGVNVGVGLLSTSIALLGNQWVAVAGYSYFLVGVGQTIHGTVAGSRRRKLEKRAEGAALVPG